MLQALSRLTRSLTAVETQRSFQSLSLWGHFSSAETPYLKISIISSAQKDKARMISYMRPLPVSCQTYLSPSTGYFCTVQTWCHSFCCYFLSCDIYDLLWLPHTYTHRHTHITTLIFLCLSFRGDTETQWTSCSHIRTEGVHPQL